MINRTAIPALTHRRFLDAILICGAALLSLFVGFSLVSRPVLAALPIAALVGLLLLADGRARVVFLVAGGLLTLQSSQELNLSKLAYLLGVGVAFVGAVMQLRGSHHAAYRVATPLLRVSVIFFALVFLSFFVSQANDTPLTMWLRDIAPYVLFASAPVFALDAESSLGSSGLKILLAVAGVISASSFMIEWVERRQIAELSISRLAFPSFLLAAALFAYALSAVLRGGGRQLAWVLLASFGFMSLLLTGTRAAFALLAAPVGIALAGRRQLGSKWLRLAVLGSAALAAAFFAFQSVGSLVDADKGTVEARFELLRGDLSSDQSYRDRLTQTEVTWDLFRAHPLFGVGPGHTFEWRDVSGFQHSTLNPDTSVSLLAKFGVLGLGAVVAGIIGYAFFLARLARHARASVAHLALSGYAAVVVARAMLQLPFDDKGLALALVILVALALRELRDRESTQPISSARAEDGL